MADNTTFSAGTADGDTYASDDIGGVKYARTKIVIGADGTNDGDVASGNPLPVSGTVDLGATDNEVLDAIAASLAGTLTVGSHAVTNAGTFAVQVDGAALTALQLIDDAIYADDADWTDGTSKHMLIGGLYQSTRQTITDGDVGPIQLTSDGLVITQIADGAGNHLEFAKENDNWNSADHGVILFARDTDSTPDKYRAVQVDANGHLKIGDGGDTITVDNAGTFAVQAQDGSGNSLTSATRGAEQALSVQLVDASGNQITSFGGTGGTSETDDGAFTAGTGLGTPAMGFFSADTVDAGDVGVLAMDASRRLLVSIEADNAGIGGGTQYTEDDAVPANPVGNALLAERDDALGGITPIEGDWTNLFVDANGALWVNVNASALPTGAATSANQSTANASLATIAGDTTSLDGKVTACNTGDVTIGAALPAGTNAIGKLAANSGVDIGDVDVTSIAAGTNTIGGTIAQLSSSTAYDGTTACTIKRKSGVVAAAATTAILAAVTDKKFRILAFQLLATSATANTFYLATTTDTDVLGSSSATIPIAMDADGDNAAGFSMAWNPGGWTETSTANEALNLVTSSAAPVVYCITYIEVA